jgi:Mg2+/Co2+ transporter CorB
LSTESIIILLLVLVVLVVLSAFFSSAETAMMALNRYRLRHDVQKGKKGAKQVMDLLLRTDRLLGVILIGNTFANILASAIATIITVHFFGDLGVVISAVVLTLVILVFAEVTPKTAAAIHPQRWAMIVSRPLWLLLKLFYPLVCSVNGVSNTILRLLGMKSLKRKSDELNQDELRTVLAESKGILSGKYLGMLLNILDLKKLSVQDIMIPKNQLYAIDIEEDLKTIEAQIKSSARTRIPVYRENIDHIFGMLHLRRILPLLSEGRLTKEALVECGDDCYFVPESTALYTQLLNFQKEKQRSALVVDEYGDIQGLITLEDILEEIVGEFTTNEAANSDEVVKQKEGGYLVDGNISVRDLNRNLNWQLPTEGAKTLSGLIIDYLQVIPQASASVKINSYCFEIVELKENRIKLVKASQL